MLILLGSSQRITRSLARSLQNSATLFQATIFKVGWETEREPFGDQKPHRIEMCRNKA